MTAARPLPSADRPPLREGEALPTSHDFHLEPEAFDAFMDLLETPALPSPGLVALMGRKAPWDV